jgi:hypothetical protein
MEQGGEDKCWRCGGPHKKKDYPNPPQATTSNPKIPTNHVPITMYMVMLLIITSHFVHSYDKASHKTPMSIKAKVLRKARKGKVLQTRG